MHKEAMVALCSVPTCSVDSHVTAAERESYLF